MQIFPFKKEGVPHSEGGFRPPSRPPGAYMNNAGCFASSADPTPCPPPPPLPPPPSVCATVQRLPSKAGEASRDNGGCDHTIHESEVLPACLPPCLPEPPPTPPTTSASSWDAGNGYQTRQGAVCPPRPRRSMLAVGRPLKFLCRMTEIRIIFTQASCLWFSAAESPGSPTVRMPR